MRKVKVFAVSAVMFAIGFGVWTASTTNAALCSAFLTAQSCRRNDLRRWPDGTVVEYIDQRSMKPLSIHRLVQKVV